MAKKKIVVPKSLEKMISGGEPINVDLSSDKVSLIKAYNYFSYSHNRDDGSKFLINYLKSNPLSFEIDENKIKHIDITNCWIAKLLTNSCILSDTTMKYFKTNLEQLKNENVKIDIPVQRVKNTVNNALIAVEDIIDDRLRGKKTKVDFQSMIRQNNFSAKDCSEVVTYYTPILEETLNSQRDSQIREAYSKYTRDELKEIQDFYKDVVKYFDLASVTQKRKVVRKPKTIKPVMVEKLLARVKYQQNSSEFNVSSIDPKNVLDSTVVIMYNTKTKTISYISAIEGQKLSFRGSKLINYEVAVSFSKKVRKPEVTIPKVLTQAKMSVKKELENLTTKPNSPDVFSMNENILILKSYK